MRTAAAAFVLLGACLDQPSGGGVVGSPADMQTVPGDYAGYRVVTACATTSIHVGVVGTGTIAPTALDDISAANRDLQTQLVDFETLWGVGGYGLVCEPGVGINLWTND